LKSSGIASSQAPVNGRKRPFIDAD
jgi:hypothetical protein